jgi:O-antigen/teichoic acid export membrane protein
MPADGPGSGASPSAGPARAPRLSRTARGGLALGVGTGISTALGYAFTAVLARSFGPGEYGALVALLGAGLIGTIPASGLQYVVARRTVALGLPAGRNDGPTLLLSGVTGVLLCVLIAAGSPLIKDYLHLASVGPVLALGVTLIPMTVSGAMQGGLLGHHRLPALSSLMVLTAVARFAGGALTAAMGWDVTGAMACLAAAAVVTTVVGYAQTGPASWGVRAAAVSLRMERALAGDVARACSAVAGIVVLTNVDLLLARHYLPADVSGAYGVASLFAKAMLWGTQFVAQAAFPALARPEQARKLLAQAVGGTAAIGAVGVLATVLAAGPVVRVATGQGAYDEAVRLAPWFALLGLGWALAQVLLLAAVAAGERTAGRILWLVIAAEAGAIATGLHGSAGQILSACVISVGWYALAAALLARSAAGRPAGAHRREDTPVADLHVDGGVVGADVQVDLPVDAVPAPRQPAESRELTAAFGSDPTVRTVAEPHGDPRRPDPAAAPVAGQGDLRSSGPVPEPRDGQDGFRSGLRGSEPAAGDGDQAAGLPGVPWWDGSADFGESGGDDLVGEPADRGDLGDRGEDDVPRPRGGELGDGPPAGVRAEHRG